MISLVILKGGQKMTIDYTRKKSPERELCSQVLVLKELKAFPSDYRWTRRKLIARALCNAYGFNWEDINEAVIRLIEKGVFIVGDDYLLRLGEIV